MQCLLLILRKTYGFNKKTDSISLSQFEKHTKIARRNIIRALNQLCEKNIIHIKKGGVKNDTIITSKYRFNKRFKNWNNGVKIDTGGVKRGKKRVSNLTHTKDTNTKENNIPPISPKPNLKNHLKEKIIETGFIETKEKIFEFFEYRQQMTPTKRYKSTKGIDGLFRDITGCRNANLIVSDCLDIAMERDWLRPAPEYFQKNKKVNRYESVGEHNTRVCKEWANGN